MRNYMNGHGNEATVPVYEFVFRASFPGAGSGKPGNEAKLDDQI